MTVQLIHFLFSVANNFSVGVSVVLALIWFLSLGFYIGKKLVARTASVNLESFNSDMVAKAPARL